MRSDFPGLFTGQYLTGSYGSSAADLQSAAQMLGLQLHPYSSMTLAHLRMVRSPVILHFRTSGSGTQYIHWCLFLGFEGEKVRLYDPPRAEVFLTADEVLALWDGTGLVVTPAGESVPTPVPLDSAAIVATTGLLLLLACAYRVCPSFLAVPLVALASGLLWQLFGTPSFLKDRSGLDLVALAHFRPQQPEVDYDAFEAERGGPGAVLVDARLPQDYQSGHVPDAVNIPATASIPSLQRTLADIPRDRHVIVYCANSKCGWADEIANQFAQRGYRASVYRGGYEEWTARRPAGHAPSEANP